MLNSGKESLEELEEINYSPFGKIIGQFIAKTPLALYEIAGRMLQEYPGEFLTKRKYYELKSEPSLGLEK